MNKEVISINKVFRESDYKTMYEVVIHMATKPNLKLGKCEITQTEEEE